VRYFEQSKKLDKNMRRLSCPEKSKKVSRVWLITLSLLVLSFVSQFIVSNVLALKGEEVVRATEKTIKLSRQNQELREALASEMSMTKVASDAQNLGLSQASNLKYFDLSQPVAALPQ
jgi:hypothetical protein